MITDNIRCQWMRDRILNEPAIYTPLRIVSYYSANQTDEATFNEECLQVLRQACVERIESEAVARTLLDVKDLGRVLLEWQEWIDNRETFENFIQYLTEAPDRIALLLTSFITYGYFLLPTPGIYPQIKRDDLGLVVDLDELQIILSDFLAEDFNLQGFPKDQQIAVNTFLQPPTLLQE
jgi:hypothetical protein